MLLPEVLSVLLPASVLLLAELSVLFSEELADLLLFDPHATVPKDNIAAMHNIVQMCIRDRHQIALVFPLTFQLTNYSTAISGKDSLNSP